MQNKNVYCFGGDQIQRKETNNLSLGQPTKDENACISVWVL